MKEAELRKQLARICLLLLLYHCLKNLANPLMLLKKKEGGKREGGRGGGERQSRGRKRTGDEKGGRGKHQEEGGEN